MQRCLLNQWEMGLFCKCTGTPEWPSPKIQCQGTHAKKEHTGPQSRETERMSSTNISVHNYYISRGLHLRGHVKNWWFSSNGNY